MVSGGALLTQLLNGLTIGMVYVLLAAGLSIIFGVMDVINFAHGEFFALGAYFAVAVAAAPWGGFWVALLLAPLVVAAVGAGVERFTIRPLYGRNPLYHILLTFGLVLIFKDVIEFAWGQQPIQYGAPAVVSGSAELFGFQYAVYSWFVIAVGAVLAGATWLALTRTRVGLVVRAGSMDRDMVRYLGIDIDRYYTLVFAFGALLAAVAGIVLAPRTSVSPGMGDQVIIPAFVIVVLGGLGSFRGAVVGGLGIGVLYSSYYVNALLVTILVWALFALSLDFVMGYAGLVSLGHVLFYGVGAYAAMLTALYLVPSVFVALLVGALVCIPLAWAIGQLSIRVSGVYFAMITLGFAELFAQLPFKIPALNGENGLGPTVTYGLAGSPEVGDVALLGEIHLFYYLVLALVVASYLLARQFMRAPFGSVLQAIRESDQRAAFVGYDVTAYKRRAFVVSGALAGLAGGLAAVHTGGVFPSSLAWIKSGEVIVMTLLGGMGTLYGPMLGAGVFLGGKEVLQEMLNVDQWQGVLGIVFVLFVIYVPRGMVSLPT